MYLIEKQFQVPAYAVRAFEHERTLGCRDVVAEAIKLLLLPAHLFCGEFVEIFLPTEAQ